MSKPLTPSLLASIIDAKARFEAVKMCNGKRMPRPWKREKSKPVDPFDEWLMGPRNRA